MNVRRLQLLRAAARECRMHYRAARIEDLAATYGLSHEIDDVLAEWARLGWWDYVVRPRAGFVTRDGVAALREPEKAAAA